jgi:hypothetical protein
MNIQLPILAPRDYQKSTWNYMLQEKPGLRGVTVWPRRNGKDLTAINILAAKAIQRKGLYYYIAPFANQVRSIIWDGSDGSGKRFLDYIPPEIITRKLDQQMKIWLSNGSLIHLVGSDNPDAVVGTNPLGIVFTEFSLHKPGIWGYMRPVLAENGGWALFNGTPRGMNHFYDLAKMAEENPDWFYERLTCIDTGYPSLQEIDAERKAGMPESLIEQEFYVSWSASSEETLIPLDKVEICVNLDLPPESYNFAPRVIGVDPAYAEKGDRAVIIRRQGRKVFEPEVFQGIDPMALATRVAAILRDWKAHYCFIDAGRGEAIWSRLYQLGFEDRVIPVHFDGATYDDLYHRKKDEMWGRAKTAICDPERPLDLPDVEGLKRDLSAPTFEINDRGKMQIESKKELKKRGFRSTDLGDALVLTFAEELDETPVLTPEMEALGVTENMLMKMYKSDNGTQQDDYDPLSYMDRYSASKGNFV